MKYLLTSILAGVLCACGGGGGSSPQTQAAAACTSPHLTVQLFGDSTQAAQFDIGTLQLDLNAKYGANSVTVVSNAVSGTTSGQLIAGADGKNLPWPGSVTGDIVLVNHAINDERDATDITTFTQNYRAFSGVKNIILETPSPMTASIQDPRYADAIRAVGLEKKVPVIDVDAYVRTLPNWQQLLVDGMHPSGALVSLIATNVLMPVLQQVIDPTRCK
jgi:hypothetical protein